MMIGTRIIFCGQFSVINSFTITLHKQLSAYYYIVDKAYTAKFGGNEYDKG
jgi:hypothetical protein